MLRYIREGAIDNPWFFRIVMLGIAAVFAVSMGWWGFGDNEDPENVLAQVGEDRIMIIEYRRAYQNASKFYRELFQGDYDDEALRRRVIDELVERRLWVQEAQRMQIFISDESLKGSITAMPGFQREGTFDSELYKRALASERYTPKSFEARQRNTLLVKKAQLLVRSGVWLTPTEIKEAQESNPANPSDNKTIEDRLSRKKERAMRAYAISLKQKAGIVIKDELL
ncbi:MAG: SurA N-terminal domain-containing protein [Nitrospirota bacterium]|nr:SurA N-terminal domain-containing protein [Nitrospirota bacterium]